MISRGAITAGTPDRHDARASCKYAALFDIDTDEVSDRRRGLLVGIQRQRAVDGSQARPLVGNIKCIRPGDNNVSRGGHADAIGARETRDTVEHNCRGAIIERHVDVVRKRAPIEGYPGPGSGIRDFERVQRGQASSCDNQDAGSVAGNISAVRAAPEVASGQRERISRSGGSDGYARVRCTEIEIQLRTGFSECSHYLMESHVNSKGIAGTSAIAVIEIDGDGKQSCRRIGVAQIELPGRLVDGQWLGWAIAVVDRASEGFRRAGIGDLDAGAAEGPSDCRRERCIQAGFEGRSHVGHTEGACASADRGGMIGDDHAESCVGEAVGVGVRQLNIEAAAGAGDDLAVGCGWTTYFATAVQGDGVAIAERDYGCEIAGCARWVGVGEVEDIGVAESGPFDGDRRRKGASRQRCVGHRDRVDRHRRIKQYTHFAPDSKLVEAGDEIWFVVPVEITQGQGLGIAVSSAKDLRRRESTESVARHNGHHLTEVVVACNIEIAVPIQVYQLHVRGENWAAKGGRRSKSPVAVI